MSQSKASEALSAVLQDIIVEDMSSKDFHECLRCASEHYQTLAGLDGERMLRSAMYALNQHYKRHAGAGLRINVERGDIGYDLISDEDLDVMLGTDHNSTEKDLMTYTLHDEPGLHPNDDCMENHPGGNHRTNWQAR